MKINTPLRFTIFSSIISSLFLIFLIFCINYFILETKLLYHIYFYLFILLFAFSGIVTYFLLEIFINRKIRLLFRMVQTYKMSSSDFNLNMNEDILSESEEKILMLGKKNSAELVKLKSEEKFRREFIGNLAHELKTPIFSVQGYILTLLEGGLNDSMVNEKFLKRALKGVNRMNKLIMDLDMITRFESDRINLEIEENNILEICQDIFDSLELKAKEKNISISYADTYINPIMVKCDSNRIGQVMQNLIINAINYSKSESKVIVRFLEIESNILIEVEDNGPGIDKKYINRLFERFYRVDKSRARNEGGTGLGLSIVKHIVEAHGHNVQVRSTEGEGSTFFFTLTKI